jgi:hypothetical protein
MRRSPAIRASISSIFTASRVRRAWDGGHPAAQYDAQVVLDFGQGEAERLGVLDRTEETDRVLVVTPVPARRAGRFG